MQKKPQQLSADRKATRAALPQSATSFPITLVGLCSLLLMAYYVRHELTLTPIAATLLLLCALAIPIVILDMTILKVYQRPSTGLDLRIIRNFDLGSILTKLLGFYVTFAILALLYWLIPLYHSKTYLPFWDMIRIILPLILIWAIPYFIYIDRRMLNSKDGYWQFGALLRGKHRELDWNILKQYFLAWLVKGFFLPLMLSSLVSGVIFLRTVDLSNFLMSAPLAYTFLLEFLLAIDLLFACIGYTLTLRLTDSHIRSAEPTLGGWLCTIICYEPFWGLLYGSYLAYDSDQFAWGNWLSQYPIAYTLWGGCIITLLALYVLSHSTFGIRFSNLTHRGILTNGNYRFTKHPAYVAKNLMWWLMAVPFIPEQGFIDALRDCVLLFGVNLIYFARARTEERHLSRDPVYVQYALAMNELSIFARLGRVIPYLRYQAPATYHSAG